MAINDTEKHSVEYNFDLNAALLIAGVRRVFMGEMTRRDAVRYVHTKYPDTLEVTPSVDVHYLQGSTMKVYFVKRKDDREFMLDPKAKLNHRDVGTILELPCSSASPFDDKHKKVYVSLHVADTENNKRKKSPRNPITIIPTRDCTGFHIDNRHMHGYITGFWCKDDDVPQTRKWCDKFVKLVSKKTDFHVVYVIVTCGG